MGNKSLVNILEGLDLGKGRSFFLFIHWLGYGSGSRVINKIGWGKGKGFPVNILEGLDLGRGRSSILFTVGWGGGEGGEEWGLEEGGLGVYEVATGPSRSALESSRDRPSPLVWSGLWVVLSWKLTVFFFLDEGCSWS